MRKFFRVLALLTILIMPNLVLADNESAIVQTEKKITNTNSESTPSTLMGYYYVGIHVLGYEGITPPPCTMYIYTSIDPLNPVIVYNASEYSFWILAGETVTSVTINVPPGYFIVDSYIDYNTNDYYFVVSQ